MFQIPLEAGKTLFSRMPRLALRLNKLPIQTLRANIFLAVKKQERKAKHSAPYSAETKKKWSCTSTLFYAFVVCT
jgi:hypothetical protein